MVHSVGREDRTATVSGLMSRDYHANRSGFSNVSAANVYGFCQQAVPGQLAGNLVHPIPGMKDYNIYHQQDGNKGTQHVITRGVKYKAAALMSLMSWDPQAHPVAFAVFTHVNTHAEIHWKYFTSFLSGKRNVYHHQCCDATESWLYPCKVGRGVLDECYKL